jgi:hypothetical protein
LPSSSRDLLEWVFPGRAHCAREQSAKLQQLVSKC